MDQSKQSPGFASGSASGNQQRGATCAGATVASIRPPGALANGRARELAEQIEMDLGYVLELALLQYEHADDEGWEPNRREAVAMAMAKLTESIQAEVAKAMQGGDQ